ncbi:MAG TPA: hypothetical protein VGC92_07095 [Phenylobacterium sp.]|jgi:hypothetical protein
MRWTDWAWTGLRWLFAFFFFSTGVAIVAKTVFGIGGYIHQPTAAAQALDTALHQSGFMDPLLGASYLVGGAAMAWRRTAPLGIVLLGPAVVVIFFFDTFLARLPIPGVLTLAVWGVLALRFLPAYQGLWTFGVDTAKARI